MDDIQKVFRRAAEALALITTDLGKWASILKDTAVEADMRTRGTEAVSGGWDSHAIDSIANTAVAALASAVPSKSISDTMLKMVIRRMLNNNPPGESFGQLADRIIAGVVVAFRDYDKTRID